ncbi:hypothetical protein [Saccharolobus islandicus]|uniref:Uncharacterized protein n=1 Tax=Saccharolobus islandicus (strain M.16.27) TaxID=427318 RepID=C3N616_SACI3|nr:hypothetical protein [Sulfolobus islandicus]ACP55441.1 hypothetical protein M1627_1557 [Sulfolobus islandicus M.16.27]
MLSVKEVLERIMNIVRQRGYETETYSNHLIIYDSEFKVDITVIDDNIIIVESRDFPKDKIRIVKVREMIEKDDIELLRLLNLD